MAGKAASLVSVNEAVHRLQNYLLEGIADDDQLFAAGSIMSRTDYEDVVTERSIVNLCGYPLCRNGLPSERPRKGRYRISLKEHKVYDLRETYKYCSQGCVVNSRTFSGCLQEERCSVLNPAKLDEVFGLFEGLSKEENEKEDGDFGMSKLKIQEKEVKNGEVSMEQWAGPSNAIEGYVPKQENKLKPQKQGPVRSKAKPDKANHIINDFDFANTIIAPDEYSISKLPSSSAGTAASSESELLEQDSSRVDSWDKPESKTGAKPSKAKPDKANLIINDFDFSSTIIASDEYSVSKVPPSSAVAASSSKSEESAKVMSQVDSRGKSVSKAHPKPRKAKPDKRLIINDFDFSSTIIAPDEYSVSKLPPSSAGSASCSNLEELKVEDSQAHSGNKPPWKHTSHHKSIESRVDWNHMSTVDVPSTSNACPSGLVELVKGSDDSLNFVKMDGKPCSDGLKSSLKSSGSKKVNRSVTWADEKECNSRNGNLCDVRNMEDAEAGPSASKNVDIEDEESLLRLSSAEACAMALNQAAEAIATGKCDASEAVLDAGLIILPLAHGEEESVSSEEESDTSEDPETAEVDLPAVKWPKKTVIPTSDAFHSEDSWFDAPPEGFSLALSPFATMWGALFSWITSSSLAYIYGQDESFHEEYQSVNGREYPSKIVLADGRSAEIKQTLAGILARALPGLVADLRLPIPISTLEQALGHLLDTMSFLDALPSFRVKQWQVVLLLFVDALSISRVPALTVHMTNGRALLHKVLDSARIGVDEYGIMKDLLIPLGRAPRFSAQSGA